MAKIDAMFAGPKNCKKKEVFTLLLGDFMSFVSSVSVEIDKTCRTEKPGQYLN